MMNLGEIQKIKEIKGEYLEIQYEVYAENCKVRGWATNKKGEKQDYIKEINCFFDENFSEKDYSEAQYNSILLAQYKALKQVEDYFSHE